MSTFLIPDSDIDYTLYNQFALVTEFTMGGTGAGVVNFQELRFLVVR